MVTEPSSAISHEGYISIMITILAVIVGVLAIIAGLLAIVGYQAVVDAAKKKAEDIATRVAQERVTEVAVKAAAEATDKYLRERDLSKLLVDAITHELDPASNAKKAVGEPYPGKEGI